MAGELKRRLGPGLLTAYGVGVMVGAGIYVLVGAVVGQAGVWAPLSFVLAGLVAMPTALTYAELTTRVPEAAGEAAYVELGLGAHRLAVLIGLAIIVAGTVSAAAVLRGGVGYLTALIDLPSDWAIVGLGALLTLIAMVGVLESLTVAAVLTAIEVAGLAMVIWAGFHAAPVADWQAPPPPQWVGVAGAAGLAFFAFIGFEDLANMAEEAKAPERTMPRAILAALTITALLYALVSLAAVRAVPVEALAGSTRPLALVWQHGTGGNAAFLSAIAVFAALNGILAQIVMAARVLFGLGRRTRWLSVFHNADKRFGTPVLATLLLGAGVVIAALKLEVQALAEVTSAVLLGVFAVVNTALIGFKRQSDVAPFRVPLWVPVLGLVAALAALAGIMGGVI
ncbi:APC family permease [Acidimangrovimonas pyrenivorans]|uniref:APC family permease n=1 Tax=Acidimangrovimonas pyrenivorans TaxID=2030798 RepID=A0ABV7AHI1_9RHOB